MTLRLYNITIDGETKSIGSAWKYVSVCKVDYTLCTSPCYYLVIANILEILQVQFSMDSLTGETAHHIHCVRHHSKVFFSIYIIMNNN